MFVICSYLRILVDNVVFFHSFIQSEEDAPLCINSMTSIVFEPLMEVGEIN